MQSPTVACGGKQAHSFYLEGDKMLCKWSHGLDTYEFDAKTKAEEIKIVREFAKARGCKFKDMVKENKE